MRIKKRRVRGKWTKVYYAWVPKPNGGTRLVSTNCTDKEAARSRAAELERCALAPREAAPVSTKEACARFLESRIMIGRSEETARFYGVKLRNLVTLLPEMISDVTHNECEKYISKRREDVQNATIKKELRTLNSVLRHARRNGYFKGDPHEIIPEFDGNERARRRTLANREELEALCAALTPNRAQAVRAIVATGARRSEAYRFDPSSDMEAVDGQWHVHLHGKKTEGSERTVVLVRPWQQELLSKQTARPIGEWTNIVRDLQRACERAKIPKVTTNDLRRTFGTWLERDGVPRWAIAKALGHTSTRMVDKHYSVPTTQDIAAAMKVEP